jgi:outer membrane protein OmpA-like peptidoglycan-associated protein
MLNHRLSSLSLVTLATLTACSLTPPKASPLDVARSNYAAAQSNPQVVRLAPAELSQAGDALNKANDAWNKSEDAARIDQLAYVARQRVAIAEETARQKASEMTTASAGTARDKMRLDARTAEADTAQRNAEASQRSAEASQRQSEESQRSAQASQRQSEASQLSAEASQRQSAASQQQSEASRLNAEASQRESEASQRQAQDADARSRRLEAQLKELDAKKTARGLVITFGDVLFDTNKAQLSPGGMRGVQKLAGILKQYPQRNVLVEGFTDSVGSSASNQDLSDRRARAVRTALQDTGISAERIANRGYGQTFPVATNATAAGRQLNRRVEIVVSEDDKAIAPR